MGIRLRNFHRGSTHHSSRWREYYEHPSENLTRYVNAFSIAAAVPGTALTLVNSPSFVAGHALYFQQTEAAGATLSVTYRIVGKDHLFDDVVETITIATTATVHTTAAFSRIDSITITAIANNAAGDLISVGIAFNAGTPRIGVPRGIKALSDIKAIIDLNSGGVHVTVSNFNANHMTVQIGLFSGRRGLYIVYGDHPEL